MSITKPYFRIMRPTVRKPGMTSDDLYSEYILDRRYSADRFMLCSGYKILEQDLKTLFEYIEPSNDNLSTYSHRTYELLLRASTEFETNCKQILNANSYSSSRSLNIIDYNKLNPAMRLSDYSVVLNFWRPGQKIIKPFDNWSISHTLNWYQAYNNVKHDRHINFHDASLENTIYAVAAVYTILFAQFSVFSFNPYQQISMYEENDDNSIFMGESIFSIKQPIWIDADRYDFDWNLLKGAANPFERYPL